MQKHVNLVDLVKSFPTTIFLQNLASIQKRTSPIKFAHLAEKSEKSSISNRSTKVQIDTHAPTPAPTPRPTPANVTEAPDEVSTRNAGIFSYLMGSLPGGQDSSVGIGVLASFGALLVCGATYATYVRVQHPSRQKGALSTKARQGGSGAANYAPEPVRDVYSLPDVASSGSLKDATKLEADKIRRRESQERRSESFFSVLFDMNVCYRRSVV